MFRLLVVTTDKQNYLNIICTIYKKHTVTQPGNTKQLINMQIPKVNEEKQKKINATDLSQT
jgi:broad specificity polyphosphatase/5'/3'-nucleotidase SurE